MSGRLEHWRSARDARAHLAIFQRELGLHGFSWRSWAHHPFANLRYAIACAVPHAPDWELDAMTVGAIDHEGVRDADWYVINVTCRRCGTHRDEGA